MERTARTYYPLRIWLMTQLAGPLIVVPVNILSTGGCFNDFLGMEIMGMIIWILGIAVSGPSLGIFWLLFLWIRNLNIGTWVKKLILLIGGLPLIGLIDYLLNNSLGKDGSWEPDYITLIYAATFALSILYVRLHSKPPVVKPEPQTEPAQAPESSTGIYTYRSKMENEFVLETERLYLRPILHSDEEGIFELDSNPAVHAYLGNRPITTRAQAREAIEYIRRQYLENGIGRWAVIDKKTSEFIGWAGLKFIGEEINGVSGFYDVGYRLIERYWGRGLATEATNAALDYAFNTLKLPEVYGMCDVRNKASRRVLEKAGFTWLGTFILDGDEHDWLIRRS